MCIKGDLTAIIEGKEMARYIKQGPSTRRILDENLMHNYAVKPYVRYLQIKHELAKKKKLVRKPEIIVPQ